MLYRLTFILFLSFFLAEDISAQKQIGTLQIRFLIRGRVFKKPVKKENVKVTVGDSTTRYLITDKKGRTGYLELNPGKHDLTFHIEGFKDRSRKGVKIAKGSGNNITVRMKKTGPTNREKDEIKQAEIDKKESGVR